VGAGVFGPKKQQLEALAGENAALRQQLDQLQQAYAAQGAQVQNMMADLQRFGVLDHRAREAEFGRLRAPLTAEREHFERQREEQQRRLEADRKQQLEHTESMHDALLKRINERKNELEELSQQLIPFTEEAVFQEAGISRYHHPLQNAEAYKAALAAVQADMKKDGTRRRCRVLGNELHVEQLASPRSPYGQRPFETHASGIQCRGRKLFAHDASWIRRSGQASAGKDGSCNREVGHARRD
jgi:hypothetical protein